MDNVLAGDAAARKVLCPYCGSANTELFSLFGQQLLTVQYYCQSCHTPFECVKDDALLDEQGAFHVAAPPGKHDNEREPFHDDDE